MNIKMSTTSDWALVVLTIVLCRLTIITSKAASMPNILFILVDDLRPTLGCYGDPIAATPNIDGLAKKSALFERAYVQQSSGGPSRTSFLTGRRPDTTRAYDNNFYWRHHAGNYTTLPQHFKENGYLTHSVGSVFHFSKTSNWTDDYPYSWSFPPYHPPSKEYPNIQVCPGADGTVANNVICPVDVSRLPGATLPDMLVIDHAIAFLRSRMAHREQPFFLGVGLQKPHVPFKYPKDFLDLYPMSEMHLAPNPTFPAWLPVVAWNPWTDFRDFDDVKALNVSFPFGPIDPDFQLKLRQSYYAATSYLDSQVGRLLQAVDRNGFAGNTIIVLVGDNGVSLGEHQQWSKYSNYEVSVKVPLMIYIPEMTSKVNVPGSNFPFHDVLANVQDYGPQAIKAARQEEPFVISSQLMSKMTYEKRVRTKRRVFRHLLSFPASRDDSSNYPTSSNSSGNVQNHPHRALFLDDGRWRQIFKGSVLPFVTRVGIGVAQTGETSKASLDYRLSLHVDKHVLRGLQASAVPLEYPLVTMALAELVDLFPTLAGIAGLAVPPLCPPSSFQVSFCTEGVSLLPVIRNMSRDLGESEALGGSLESGSRPQNARRDSANSSAAEWKRAAFSQCPRPSVEPALNSDQPRLEDVRIMGYSMRTDAHRYTEWLPFSPVRGLANWTYVYAKELYLHDLDPFEDHNVAYVPQYVSLVDKLSRQLREGWRSQLPATL